MIVMVSHSVFWLDQPNGEDKLELLILVNKNEIEELTSYERVFLQHSGLVNDGERSINA